MSGERRGGVEYLLVSGRAFVGIAQIREKVGVKSWKVNPPRCYQCTVRTVELRELKLLSMACQNTPRCSSILPANFRRLNRAARFQRMRCQRPMSVSLNERFISVAAAKLHATVVAGWWITAEPNAASFTASQLNRHATATALIAAISSRAACLLLFISRGLVFSVDDCYL